MKRKTIFNNSQRRWDMIFYTALVILPLTQFALMYVAVNFRSIMFAFQEYDPVNSVYKYNLSFFAQNFTSMITEMFGSSPLLGAAWKNSAIFYLVGLLVSTPLSIIVSFFIYKKLPLSGYFRIVFYLPAIVNSFAVILGFKYFIDRGLPALFPGVEIFTKLGGLLSNPETMFGTLIFYGVWIGLGGNLVLMTGVMSRVNNELLEASKIDGVNLFQEFRHIVWPVIYPVVTIGLYTGIVVIFSGAPAIYAFFGADKATDEHSITFGYYFFTLVVGNKSSFANYPRAATGGLIFTFIAAPIVFMLKYWLEKHDPNGDFVSARRVRRINGK